MSVTKKFFFDTEFNDEVGDCRVEPISIGLVTECGGMAYYGVSNEFNEAAAHQWLKDNVIPKLPPFVQRIPLKVMREEIIGFFAESAPPNGEEGKAQLWGKNPGGDMITLGLIFGGLSKFYTAMNEIGFRRTYFNDTDTLRTQLFERFIKPPRLTVEEADRHTAIGDAIQEREEYRMMKILLP